MRDARTPEETTPPGGVAPSNGAVPDEHRALLEEITASGVWPRLVWDSAPDAMVLSDSEGVVLMANPAYCELYGYGPEEVVGRSYAIIFPPEQRAWAVEQYRAAYASPTIGAVHETWIRRKDDTERFVQARAEFLVRDGRRRAMLSIIRDVTARKEAEDALRDSEERFRVMADSSPFMIWATDPEGGIEFVNRAYCEFFGVTREQIKGPDWQPLVHPEDADDYIAGFLGSLRARQPWTGQARVRRADGEWRWIESRSTPRFSPTGAFLGSVGSSPDITERKALEALQQQFIASVGHELRNPLASIRGFAQLMQRRGAYSERAIRTIVSQTDALERLIGDLLEATRLESGGLALQPHTVDLVAKARECADEARATSERHTIRVEAPGHPLEGSWDPDRLGQIFRNLLGNAVKYSPDGGEILVRVRDRGDGAEVSIRDRGLGIPPEDVAKLFDRFYRVGSASAGIHGLGLGLHITRELVEGHGGRIWAESDGPGRGSTFVFTLPYRAAEDGDTAAAPAGQVAVERHESA